MRKQTVRSGLPILGTAHLFLGTLILLDGNVGIGLFGIGMGFLTFLARKGF